MATRNRDVPFSNRAEHEMREQEVLRANKELAAYFKGRRTEREARAALKIIKAFIRERERTNPANRRPLPGADPASVAAKVGGSKRPAHAEIARRRSRGHRLHREPAKDADALHLLSTEPPAASSKNE